MLPIITASHLYMLIFPVVFLGIFFLSTRRKGLEIIRELYQGKIFSPDGRASRAEFFLVHIFLFFLSFVFVLIITGGFPNINQGWAILIYFLAVTIFMLLVVIRRLHDLGLVGYWCVLYFIFMPISFFILLILQVEKMDNKFGDNPYPGEKKEPWHP